MTHWSASADGPPGSSSSLLTCDDRFNPAKLDRSKKTHWSLTRILQRTGRNNNRPVAVLAVNIPIINPRCLRNHWRTTAVIPVPIPTRTPQSRTSCHGERIKVVRATPPASRASELRADARRQLPEDPSVVAYPCLHETPDQAGKQFGSAHARVPDL